YVETKLTAVDGSAGDSLGLSVGISDDTVVVGAHADNTAAGTDAGSVYVFVRSGTAWSLQQKLTAEDAASFDFFGVSVAISGDTVVVGAYGDDTAAGSDAGSAYVLVRSVTPWSLQQNLTAEDGAPADVFGAAVAISGDTVVVGSVFDTTTAGSD